MTGFNAYPGFTNSPKMGLEQCDRICDLSFLELWNMTTVHTCNLLAVLSEGGLWD